MSTGEADSLFHAIHVDGDAAARDYRQFVLADLVALWQIGVKVILARKYRAARNGATNGKTKADGSFHRALVQHRQHARQGNVHAARLGVGRGAEGNGGAGKYL